MADPYVNHELARREADAALRIRNIVRAEGQRLGLGGSGLDSVEQTLYGHAPGYGPEMTAHQLEGLYGKFGDIPGWSNKDELAAAALGRAKAASTAFGVKEDEYSKDKSHLMTPDQAQYMQEVGRFTDLLRDMRKPRSKMNSTEPPLSQLPSFIFKDLLGAFDGKGGPGEGPQYVGPNQAALHYWDKSNHKARSREDYDDPNFSRWAGAGRAGQRFMEDSASPIASYLQVQRLIPAYIQYSTETPGGMLTSEPLQRSANLMHAADRWHLTGEGGEVLDIPSLPAGASQAERELHALQYLDRRDAAAATMRNLQPPPMQNFLNALHAKQHAFMPFYDGPAKQLPAVAGDTVQTATDMADASLGAGLIAGIPARMSVLSGLGRKYTLGPAIAGEAWQQAYPEFALGGALNYLASPANRTWGEYLTEPQPSYDLNSAARDEAHRNFENLHKTDPQSIRDATERAFWDIHGPRKPPVLNTKPGLFSVN